MKKIPFYKHLYFQVLVSIVIGILLGHFYPHIAVKMKPLGDAFIKLLKMMIAPIIFLPIATGIATMKDVGEVGRIGIKALIYFEVVTTLALMIGLVVANLHQPGAGLNIDPASLDTTNIAHYTTQTTQFSFVDFLLNIIPDSFVNAFAHSDILSLIFIGILFGFGLLYGGEKVKPLTHLLEQLTDVFFTMINFIMRVAPIGAFGAMSYTIGAYGIHTLIGLSKLLIDVYLTCILFIFIVLGTIARIAKFSLWQFLKYIKAEILIVLGTSSSETVLPRMITKLENLGCGKTLVGLVLPAGYAFNLDGACIYLTIAALFIAQALNIDLTLSEQLTLCLVFLLTSKGAAAVTGGGFIVLAATLSSMHTIPVAGIVLLLGVDRFMSEARSITNLIGNGVATVVIAKWEGDFDPVAAKKALAGAIGEELD